MTMPQVLLCALFGAVIYSVLSLAYELGPYAWRLRPRSRVFIAMWLVLLVLNTACFAYLARAEGLVPR